MSERKIRFELVLGMTENGQVRMKNHLQDLLWDQSVSELEVNRYNIQITLKGPHAREVDMGSIREDLEAWQNDNIMCTKDKMIGEA